jgi:hypothetical protein
MAGFRLSRRSRLAHVAVAALESLQALLDLRLVKRFLPGYIPGQVPGFDQDIS